MAVDCPCRQTRLDFPQLSQPAERHEFHVARGGSEPGDAQDAVARDRGAGLVANQALRGSLVDVTVGVKVEVGRCFGNVERLRGRGSDLGERAFDSFESRCRQGMRAPCVPRAFRPPPLAILYGVVAGRAALLANLSKLVDDEARAGDKYKIGTT